MKQGSPLADRRFSAQILRLCAVVAVPLLACACLLLYANADSEQQRLERETIAQAQDAAVLVELDLAGLVATAEALASAPSLARGDFASFRNFADAVGRPTETSVVVTTPGGQQLVNTRVPAGVPLPAQVTSSTLAENEEALRTRRPVVSDFFYGTAVRTPLYCVRKAVTLADGSEVVISVGRSVYHLSEVLKTKQLREGSWITLADSEGVILARTIAPDTIGRPLVPASMRALRENRATARQVSPEGVPNLAAYRKVGGSGWTVGVAVPERLLLAPMVETVVRAIALVAFALALSVTLGLLYGRRIACAVRLLTRGARALGAGEPLPAMATSIREMQEIAEALVQAQDDLAAKRREREAAEEDLRRAKVDAERASAAKARFLAAASHDLRQPLQGLALYLGALRAQVSATAGPLMDNAETCMASLTLLLNDMLDLNKFDAGGVVATPEPVAVGALLAELVGTHRPLAEDKGLRLRLVPCSASVRADPAILRRIVLNLLANAIRYTDRGGVLVGCRRRRDRLRIEVWDSGIGIAAAETDAIFEDFYQIGNPERSQAKGTGLGLAIVKRAAALLGALITVRSRPGRGTVFAIELPRA